MRKDCVRHGTEQASNLTLIKLNDLLRATKDPPLIEMAHLTPGGVYKLINAKAGNALDLSGGCNK